MKTVSEYLTMLPQPYSSAAILAVSMEGVADNTCDSLSEAIISFDWNEWAIDDTDKSWAQIYSMAVLAETDTDTMWDVPQDDIIQAQLAALEDMGLGMNHIYLN
tara:strand:- start:1054 stop:1365 length:312 start_codon:yes stop_codon:yes gene_type:complete